jgi:ABC-2 type transport system ATP-binding protein
VLDLIASLRGKVSVFLSSHILTDIERVCDTLAVLHKGSLVLVSGRDELLEAYAVNAVELELEAANAAPLPAKMEGFLEALLAQPWVANVKQEGLSLRVMVQDVPRGKRELLPLVVSHGLALNRYEWVRPSLEEIFLQLSG